MISIILAYNSDSNTAEYCKNWLQQNTKEGYELIELIDITDPYKDISEAVRQASSEIIFLMDDRICVSTNWDESILANTKRGRVVVGYLVEQISSNPTRKSIEKDFGKDLSMFKYKEFIDWANTSKKYFPNIISGKECFLPCAFSKADWPTEFNSSEKNINYIEELVAGVFETACTVSKTNAVFYKLQSNKSETAVKFVPVNNSSEKKITAVINYCTNDYAFLKSCIDGVAPFAHKVIVSMCDHLFDGTIENDHLIQKSVNENPNAHFIKFVYDKTKTSRWHQNFARRAGIFQSPPDTDYFMFLDVDEIVEPEKFKLWWKDQQSDLKDVYQFACHWYFRDFKYRAKKPDDAIVLVKNGPLISDEIVFNSNGRRCMVQNAKENMRIEMCTYNGEIFTHHYSWARSKEQLFKRVECLGNNTNRDWISVIDLEFSEPFRGTDTIFGKQYDIVNPYIKTSITTKYSLERKYKPRIATLIPTDGTNLLNLSKITDELRQVSDIYLFTHNTDIGYLGTVVPCNKELGQNLPFECKKWIKNNLNAYDFFVYNEDNTLLTSEHIDNAIFYQRNLLPINKLVGFLRYITVENKKIFIDTKEAKEFKNKKEPVGKLIPHKCKNWFSMCSLYSGNYIIHRSQVDWLILSEKWDTKYNEYNMRYNDPKQSAATTPYLVFEKYFPTDYKKISVEYMLNDRAGNDLLTDKDLKEILS